MSNAQETSPSLNSEVRPPFCRIDLRYPGVYKITGEELAEAGVNLQDVDPKLLAVSCDGNVVPFATVGTEDGSFESGDSIEFVGDTPRGTHTWFRQDNKHNIYYLTWNQAGDQLVGKAAPVAGKADKQHFWQWRHIEKDYQFSFSMLPPDQSDNFFWLNYRAGTPVEDNMWTELDLTGFDKSLKLPVYVNYELYGGTAAAGLKPSHSFKFLYNLKPVANIEFDGMTLHKAAFEIAPEQAVSGTARIGFSTPDERKNVVDSIFLNWLEVKYPSEFDAGGLEIYTFNNDLVAGSESSKTLHIKGLPAGASIFDPSTKTVWQLNKDQTTAAIPNSSRLTTYTAVAPYSRMKPDNIELVTALPLVSSVDPNLEAMVIYHPRLRETAERYTAYRSVRDWNIKAVSVREIFDLSNNGFISDLALKDYILKVKETAPGLSHVVLLGDAYFDYREARSQEELKQLDVLIPIHWVYRPGVTWSGGYQDDNWYGSFQNDFRPDIAIGRIPVNTDAEGMEYVRKVIEYETLGKSANDKSLMISSVEKSFQQYVTEIGNKYADKFTSVSYLFPEAGQAAQEVGNLLEEINSGVELLYYVGHGGSLVWRVGPADFARQKDLFTPKDVKKLTNQGHYPVVVCASCYTTAFDQPESIGEAFTNQPGGGAIAVIGAPWKATVQESHDFNRHFFNYYFDPSVKTLGEVSLKAHRDHIPENQSHALFNSFILLGDPCLEIAR